MDQHHEAARAEYPHGRGYGHDYMRGGEVFGGYGYADREEYAARRGELLGVELNGPVLQSGATRHERSPAGARDGRPAGGQS